jgi:hypothetical protein
MFDKETYIQYCLQSNSMPVYIQPWWLNCVCGENKWNVLLKMCKIQSQEILEAAFIYYMPVKKLIIMPPYTQTMGIWFNPACEEIHYSRELHRKQQICEFFLEKLPKYTFFQQHFSCHFTDWQSFYQAGFSQSTRYNYILSDISNLDNLWQHFNQNIKRNIRKAEKFALHIENNIDTESFMTLNAMTFSRQGLKAFHPNILRNLINTAHNRKQGDIFGVYTNENRLIAAIFIVWQHQTAYYIAGGIHPDFSDTGASPFLFWHVFKELSKKIQVFDFEGSMIKGVAQFFRSFGAVQIPYYTIHKGKLNFFNKIAIFCNLNLCPLHSKRHLNSPRN